MVKEVQTLDNDMRKGKGEKGNEGVGPRYLYLLLWTFGSSPPGRS